jgi:hypothetical protein
MFTYTSFIDHARLEIIKKNISREFFTLYVFTLIFGKHGQSQGATSMGSCPGSPKLLVFIGLSLGHK